tara:strand:+ start:7876 stop:9075 length:1200 start_codon:yes stop_codon:yes gene_type:complete
LATLGLMSFTAKSLNITDFAYLNIYLQWLVPITIIQSFGIPLLANIYVSGNKISLEKYIKIFFSIILKFSFLAIPLIYFTASQILNLNQEITLIYMMLIYVNLSLYFISQLLQSKKLIFESYLTANYGQRGFILSVIPTIIIGVCYYLGLSLDLKNILIFILIGSLSTLFFGIYFLKNKATSSLSNEGSTSTKELITEGFKISLNEIINTSIFPFIFTFALYYFGEETTGKYQIYVRLLFISLYFYQSILVSILIPEIFTLFKSNKKNLFNKVRFIMRRTLLYGLCIIAIFLSINDVLISNVFDKIYLLPFNEYLILSLILLIGLILNIGVPLLNYAKLNKEVLILRGFGLMIGFIILQFLTMSFPKIISINLIMLILYVLPNLIVFSYWYSIIRRSIK